ncbi:MAG TPA: class I SAM-dependent methyltransferase [Usitatibacteraceae bacterium]|nr:class I SAM-dependent methyltransferase [Usitatibacteraceae bacterium]HQY45816.1 class I SAM-dependent methyltransferase [Usitatibacteraceae bacterium]HRA21986.1 class I SAM-dependent methyltransferase [Usitatibacteraceae bacterium]
MSTGTGELVADELELLRRLVPLAGARVADIGCGDAALSRRLLGPGMAASVAALEVDRAQHAKNLAAPPVAGLSFHLAPADALPFADASFEAALMLKSLHHVPVARMDAALAEVARVLAPGGLLYVSEPVFAGPLNEVMRVFHDEEAVRAAALEALHRAAARGVMEAVEERRFDTPIAFRDFDDFAARMMQVTHTALAPDAATLAEARRRFEAHLGPGGARFVRPMRVNLVRRPAR